MLKPRQHSILIVVLALIPGFAFAGPAAQPFTLGKYVPQTCWMYSHVVYSPERAHVEARWMEVIEEVKKAGIDVEIKRLISRELSVEDRAAFDEAWATTVKLIHGVNWSDLAAKEFVFAERFGGITPDLIFLCRSTPSSVEANVGGLRAILDALASLGESFSVTPETIQETPVWSLGSPGFPFGVYVFSRDDVVGLVCGRTAAEEVLTLMAGGSGSTAIVDSPRYQDAIKRVPAAESSLAFFDMKGFISGLRVLMDTVFAQHQAPGTQPSSDVAPEQGVVARLLTQFDLFEYIVSSSRSEGLAEITTTSVRLRAEAMDRPICKMLTDRKPFEKFDRYIPESASGFSVSQAINFDQFYRAVLEFIEKDIPGGPDALEKWTQVQHDIDFDVEADLLSWLSGESVSVNLPPAIKGPFASADFVLFVRVKDDQLASAKVNAGIDRLAAFLSEREQPLMLSSAPEVNAEGFRSITHPLIAMQGLKFIVGVTDGHLVVSNSAVAINTCLDVAAGKVPSIAQNARFKEEGLMARGPICSASFSDLSNLGQELSAAFFMVGMLGSFIPDEPETRPMKAIIAILGRLSPAIAKIDFLSSSASVCTFDGQGWMTEQVLNYKPEPPPPPPAEPEAPKAAPANPQ